jgi:hypothetical protein
MERTRSTPFCAAFSRALPGAHSSIRSGACSSDRGVSPSRFAHRILIVFPFIFLLLLLFKKKAVQKIYIVMGKWINTSTYGSYKFMFWRQQSTWAIPLLRSVKPRKANDFNQDQGVKFGTQPPFLGCPDCLTVMARATPHRNTPRT